MAYNDFADEASKRARRRHPVPEEAVARVGAVQRLREETVARGMGCTQRLHGTGEAVVRVEAVHPRKEVVRVGLLKPRT